jgi:hypothetical protein
MRKMSLPSRRAKQLSILLHVLLSLHTTRITYVCEVNSASHFQANFYYDIQLKFFVFISHSLTLNQATRKINTAQ